MSITPCERLAGRRGRRQQDGACVYSESHRCPCMAQDVAVVGAGVFGAWTAWHLRARRRVCRAGGRLGAGTLARQLGRREPDHPHGVRRGRDLHAHGDALARTMEGPRPRARSIARACCGSDARATHTPRRRVRPSSASASRTEILDPRRAGAALSADALPRSRPVRHPRAGERRVDGAARRRGGGRRRSADGSALRDRDRGAGRRT